VIERATMVPEVGRISVWNGVEGREGAGDPLARLAETENSIIYSLCATRIDQVVNITEALRRRQLEASSERLSAEKGLALPQKASTSPASIASLWRRS